MIEREVLDVSAYPAAGQDSSADSKTSDAYGESQEKKRKEKQVVPDR